MQGGLHMKDKYHFSRTEQEIMDKLWSLSEPVKQTQLLEMFNAQGKEWGRQTLNTLLIRLEQRGFVVREKRMVSPAFSRKELGVKIMEEAADNYYEGNIGELFVAFAKKQSITREQAEDLKKVISDYIEGKENA